MLRTASGPTGVAAFLVLGALQLALQGCQPNIGDSCGSSLDCSATGERQCDLAQPGGYCTVIGCDPDTCPDNGNCVEWRFQPSRTAETWCMQGCSDDGRCRSGYLCASSSEITRQGTRVPAGQEVPVNQRAARIIDLQGSKAAGKICAALTQEVSTSGAVEPLTSEDDVLEDEFVEDEEFEGFGGDPDWADVGGAESDIDWQ